MNADPIKPDRLLFDAKCVRELDRIAIEEKGIPGIVLMKRAGKAVFSLINSRWSDFRSLIVFCGSGNNGGDGYVVAGLAKQAGVPVRLFEISEPERVSGDARKARQFALRQGLVPENFTGFDGQLEAGVVVVDALLGTGFTGEPSDEYARLIDLINNCSARKTKSNSIRVISADIPSGLEASTGRASSHVIRADVTVSFIGQKFGAWTGAGCEYCGELMFDGLGVPEDLYAAPQAMANVLSLSEELNALPVRGALNHKGSHGHLLVIGGAPGMGGAPLMTAVAALRTGVGLVSVATHPDHLSALLMKQPELMAHGLDSGSQIDSLLERATVIAIGPGLGTDAWAQRIMQATLASGKPLLLDADALNLLSEGLFPSTAIKSDLIMTPHPGEASRLLGITSREVQSDRYSAISLLTEKFSGVQVLKGAGTLVQFQDQLSLCSYGNPGMSSGGMGDVLTGIIAGLWAQGLQPEQAARLGVCVHSKAADLLAEKYGQRGLLAMDLIPVVRELLNVR